MDHQEGKVWRIWHYEWLNDGIIVQFKRKITCVTGWVCKYNSTTIRPVLDTSWRTKDSPALNDSLEKGKKLIDVLHITLVMFCDKNRVIQTKRAFLQTSVKDMTTQPWDSCGGKMMLTERQIFSTGSVWRWLQPILVGCSIDLHLELVLNSADGRKAGSISTMTTIWHQWRYINMLTWQDSYYPRIKLLTRQDIYYPWLNCIFRVGEHLFGSKREALIQTSVLGLLTVSTRSWSSAQADLKSYGEIVTIWGVLVSAQSISDHNGFICPITLTTINSCYKNGGRWWWTGIW